MIKDKIKQRKEAAGIAEKARKQGKIVGFTSGAFDILHAGHADCLEKAKKRCDILIVALNSDRSIKKYKGSSRPIINEKDRLSMVAAMDAVDYVFLFDERRNKENIEAVKPNLYIKAGDYKVSELTSRPIVEKYGGKALIMPLTKGISTTGIIDRIIKACGRKETEENGNAVSFTSRPAKECQAVFIDRDGVINREIEYLHEPERFELLPGVIKGLKQMQDMGFRIVIITTQAGIGLGYFTKEDFYRVNREMFRQVSKEGITIDKVYFCPHSKGEKCGCRKPETGLFERAKTDLNIDMKGSYTIGDKTSDIMAGRDAGTRTIMVLTGHAGKDNEVSIKPDFKAKDLSRAADLILEKERRV